MLHTPKPDTACRVFGGAGAHRALVDEGLHGGHEALLQRREPRNVRRHALPRDAQQLAMHKLRHRA